MKVQYKEYQASLNDSLMKKQGIDSKDKIKELVDSYKNLWKLFSKIKKEILPKSAELVQDAEFRIQRAWGFKEDYTKHRFWLDTPHCNCPKMDNLENLGTIYRIYNNTCPVHSLILREKYKKDNENL